jgi:hypothetical protein
MDVFIKVVGILIMYIFNEVTTLNILQPLRHF